MYAKLLCRKLLHQSFASSTSHFKILPFGVLVKDVKHVDGLFLRNTSPSLLFGARYVGTHKQKPTEIEFVKTGYDEPMTFRHRLKLTFRDYGTVAFGFHMTISIASLAICYLIVERTGFDITELKFVDIDKLTYFVGKYQHHFATGSNFLIAYALHKCLMPLRIMTTVTFVPLTVRYLRSKGIMKATKE